MKTMTNKIPFAALLILFGCSGQKTAQFPGTGEQVKLSGKYIITNGSFFNDTLCLKKFSEADSVLQEKTLMTFTGDSIFLERWNPDPWDGKGMLGYDHCGWSLKGGRLVMTFLPWSIRGEKPGNPQVVLTYKQLKSLNGELVFKKEEAARDGGKDESNRITGDIQLR